MTWAAAAIAIGTLRGVDLRALEMLSGSLAIERKIGGLTPEGLAIFVKVNGLRPHLVIGQLESARSRLPSHLLSSACGPGSRCGLFLAVQR